MFPYKPVCFTTLRDSIFEHKSIRFRSLQYASSRYSSACFRKVEYVSMQYQYSASQYVLVEAACSVQVSTCQYVSVRVSAFQYKSVRFTTSRYVSACFSTIEYASVQIHTWPEKTRKQKQKKSQWHHKNKQRKDQTRTLAFLRATTFFDSWLLRPHNRLIQSLCYP